MAKRTIIEIVRDYDDNGNVIKETTTTTEEEYTEVQYVPYNIPVNNYYINPETGEPYKTTCDAGDAV